MFRVERLWRWALLLLVLPGVALASGPRYVTGGPFYTAQAGIPVRWAQSQLMYYTDPGALSATVNHQAADALVAAAAGVWNVPVASITLSQGGSLAEHVSSANVYLGTNGMVFPDDVGSGNSAAVPIAVIYDADGSVTDLLLGSGASDPSGCRQNAVTESVDQFDPAGYILHALIVINGRCTGTAAEAQMQLQYQLERVFGRVLGLAWSQANDNVFTGTPTPTYEQALHWPIMHPLDVICGPYTYQCLPSPFQLRPDDLASLVLVYPNAVGAAVAAGKQTSLAAAEGVFGNVSFPTGEGMAGVNVVAQRQSSATGALEPWVEASAVTGTRFRRNWTSPFVAADTSPTGSEGSTDQSWEGRYYIAYVPLQDGTMEQTMVDSTEAVNPLYVGTHSVEPYAAGAVVPSGTMPQTSTQGQTTAGGDSYGFFTIPDAAATCGTGLDGTASAPVQVASTGWWTGQICAYGHASYLSLNVRPGRSLTVEVTALDEQGLTTTHKLMPVMGIYAPTDQPGWNLPSIAVAATAFQALGLGTTTLSASTGQLTQVTIGVADQRGDGRPDFAFQGRVFYADSILPARLPAAGGTVTITGMGFRLGNQVKVNGVAAAVTSWTPTAIVATMPTMTAAGAADKTAVDVVVADVSTGARSTMSGALTYDTSPTLPNSMKLVSAQQANAYVGSAAPVAFAVQVVAGDGVTPVAGQQVVLSVGGASMGKLAACGAASCTLMTDATGMASSTITPLQAGTVTLQAVDGTLQQTASFVAVAGDGAMTVTSAPSGNQANGNLVAVPFAVKVVGADGTTGVGGRLVTFTVTGGTAIFSGCLQSTCAIQTASDGSASLSVTPTKIGVVTVMATDGPLNKSASFTSVNSTDLMQVARQPAASVAENSSTPFGILLLHADGVTPDGYEPVTFTVSGGAVVYPCGTASCTMNTGGDGTAAVSVSSTVAGTVVVVATHGEVEQTASVTFTPTTMQMTVLSAPTATQKVGMVADKPFTVQLTRPDGTPIGGAVIAMNGPTNEVTLGACGLSGCLVTTDGNGMASTTVTTLRAGPIVVTAQYTSLNQTITFTAVGTTKSMNVVSSPAAVGYVGDPQSFQVQVIQADGVTPAAGERVTFLVTGGSFYFLGWAAPTAADFTDAKGLVGMTGAAVTAGPVTVVASDGAVSQTMSFTTVVRTDVMQLVSAPTGNVNVGSVAATPLAVQVFQADGVTPSVGRAVTFSVTTGSATMNACAAASCVVTSDANGMAAVTLTPLAGGSIALLATEGGASKTATFTAVGQNDVLKLVSAPEASATVGSTEATAFAVQAFLSDGTTPAAGKSVVFSTTAGSVDFGACGGATCTVTTGSDGMASTMVTPEAAGAISLLATEGTQTQSASVTAVAKPDRIAVVSQPGTSVLVGATAGAPYSVKVTLADGTTPVAGMNVTFSNGGTGNGQAQFAACGTATCMVATDSSGVAATGVVGSTAGAATLVATMTQASVTQSVRASLQVVSDQESLNASNPATYVAAGSAFVTGLEATATLNGSPGAGAAVTWTSSGALALAAASSTADGSGVTKMQATLGPLTAGATATATACAWTSACATFTATGVGTGGLTVTLVSGGEQSVTGGAPPAAVVAAVSDTAGHAIAGASVNAYQTVTAAPVACPAKGRCPAAPVLSTKVSVLNSDANGMVSVLPVTVSGTATETKILLTVGMQGTATADVWSKP